MSRSSTSSHAISAPQYRVYEKGETTEQRRGRTERWTHFEGHVTHPLGMIEVDGATVHHLGKQWWSFAVAIDGRLWHRYQEITTRSRFLTPRGAARVAARWLEDLHAEVGS